MSATALSRSARLALLAPALLLLAMMLAGPLGYLLSFSIAKGASTKADFSSGLTAANYIGVLGDGFYLGIMGGTVLISLVVTAVSILIGWPLAYFLWRAPERFKTLLTVAVVAPLLVSIPVRNYGWLIVLGDSGLVNQLLIAAGLIVRPARLMYTHFAVVVGLSHVLMPFVVLAVLAALERVPANLTEAAETLGASRLRAVLHVVLPLSLPGVLAGATLVFCVAVSSYVTPALMGPSGANYSATLVYQQFLSAFNWPRGAALSGVLLAITAGALLLVLGWANRRWRRLLGGG